MKKSILILLAVAGTLLLNAPAQAQSAYEQGDKILNVGISFGTYGYGFGYLGSRSGGMIPLSASVEYGINEMFSVGAYGGYASWNYKYSTYKYSYNNISVGARGSFHYLPLLNKALEMGIDEQNLDLYVSVLAGVVLRRYNSSWTDSGYGNDTRPHIGPLVGVRYLFTPKIGAFFEAGRGAVGYGTLGLTAKF